MYCSQCNQPLRDDALFCDRCGYQHAAAMQRAKVESIKAQTKSGVAAQLGSVLFLMMTLCFTAMVGAQAANMLTGGVSTFIGGILPMVFMVISAVGMWKCFIKSKKGMLDATAVQNITMYDAYNRVILTISIVLYCLFGALGVFLILRATSALGAAVGEKEAATVGGWIGVVIFLVFIGTAVAVSFCFRKIYVNRRNFFMDLSYTALTGEYKIKKAHVAGSWILGILAAITALSTVGMSALIEIGMEMFEEFLSSLGEAGEVAESEELMEALDEAVDGISRTLTISAIFSVASAAYYIFGAIWMSTVHNAEVTTADNVILESRRLADIEIATRQAVAQHVEEKRQAEEAAKAAEAAQAEEAAKAEEAAQAEESSVVE